MATSHVVHGSGGSFAGPPYDAKMTGSDTLDMLLEVYGSTFLSRISLTSFAETPLHLAALLGHLEFTKRLLKLNPELTSEQDSEKCTPLHLAAANGRVQVVRELLRADENACLVQDQDGRVPIHLAAMRGRRPAVLELLKSTQAQKSLKMKVDDGDGILHLCVKYNHLDVLKAVLASTGDDDGEVLKMTDSHGNTVLHLAVMLKQRKTVRFLVGLPTVKTEMINATNDTGLTALDVLNHSPKDYKSLEIREILVSGAGSQVETVLQPRRPSGPTQSVADRRRDEEDGVIGVVPATDGPQASNWRTRVWHRVKSLMEFLVKFELKWKEETRGALMTVSTIIATVTFAVGMAPPGGVWQEDTTESAFGNVCNNESVCLAGTAVLAYYKPGAYLLFMRYNMTSFIASLMVIFILISGVPLDNEFCARILSLVVCLTVSFLGLTFIQASKLMFPSGHHFATFIRFRRRSELMLIVWLVMIFIVGLWLLIPPLYRYNNRIQLKSAWRRLRGFCSSVSKELPWRENP